jgi:hypothetical protein
MNLGYEFRNPALLEEALTTPSCKMTSPEVRDNQRVEFLGDAVLGLLAADRIFSCRPDLGEGDLTVERTHMVSTEALRAAAVRTGLEKHLFTNKGAKEGDLKGKALADAVEAVIEAAKANGYEAIIIADHGNADNAINPDGTPNTAHSLNPVPFIYVTDNNSATVKDGRLADVAPSILHIMGLEQPKDMTGENLIVS